MTLPDKIEKMAKVLRIGYLKANHWDELIDINVEISKQRYIPIAKKIISIEIKARMDELNMHRQWARMESGLTQANIDDRTKELEQQLKELE